MVSPRRLAGLLARALERTDPGDARFVTRLTIELLRPVPLTPLTMRTRTIRPGRKVQWLEGSLLADDVEVARATALRRWTDPTLDLPVRTGARRRSPDRLKVMKGDLPRCESEGSRRSHTPRKVRDHVGRWVGLECKRLGVCVVDEAGAVPGRCSASSP